MASINVSYLQSDENNLAWIAQFDAFNAKLDIYRTVIITETVYEKEQLYELLDTHGYSVYKTNYTLADDYEFDIFLIQTQRIFITTITEYYNYSPKGLENIVDEHNFLILYNLRERKATLTTALFTSLKAASKCLKLEYFIWMVTI
jgi:hypothetical protein